MSIASDVFRPYFVDELYEVSGLTVTTFKSWVESQPQILDSYDNISKTFTFYVGDKNKLINSIAFDISRMSIASFESMFMTQFNKELHRSTAWPLIRAYYAAFFSAHAVMRMLGYAVVQFDRNQSDKLTQAIRYHANPPNVSVNEGLHLVGYHKQLNNYTVQKLNNGSHEDTWTVFSELLRKTSDKFLLDRNPISKEKKQEFYTMIDGLLEILKTKPCQSKSNWLSRLRNEINYQHKYGTWFPHEKSKNFRVTVQDNLKCWIKDPNLNINLKSHDLDKFSQACSFLVSLNRVLVNDLSERNSNGDSFLKNSAMAVLKQVME